MPTVDFRQYKLMHFSDLAYFIHYDPIKFMTFTGYLNDRIRSLNYGETLYVEDIVRPYQYNLCVKWFNLQCFLSVQSKTLPRYLLTMTEDYSGIKKTLVKK